MKTISDFLSSKASLFVILTAVVTFFFPSLFAWVKGDTQTIILGIIMLTMGLTLRPEDFRLLAPVLTPLLVLWLAGAKGRCGCYGNVPSDSHRYDYPYCDRIHA